LILVDAGPLVAILHADDAHHGECVAALRRIKEPLATVLPAVTEAMCLLAFSARAQEALFDLLLRETPRLMPLDQEDLPRVKELMRKYRDLPMDLADAALVRVAERERIRKVFTIDRRDFLTYRPAKLGRFTLLP
jgi:uncharacterized protein